MSLRNVLNILRNLISRCNCNWRYRWCVGHWSFSTIHVFTNDCNCWCCACKAWFWNKCHSSVCCYCVGTDTINCLSCWAIVKCCGNIIIHRHTAITCSKFRFTCLRCTLNICWFSWRCSWGNWSHRWNVLSCDFSTVFINTFNRYAWSSSSEWFFWNESYCSIWRNSVCSFTIYCLSGWTIFKGCRCIIIHWHIWITFCEGWFSRLCLTLNICRCRIFRSWYNWSNLRCISCFNCSSICISCLNLNWNNITWIRFICWCESNYTCIFINCVSTNHITCWWFRIYWGCWLTRFIKESNWILVNWYYFITFCEGYGSSLNHTLRSSWFSWWCSWGNWSHRWNVLSCDFSTVFINTFNRYAWSSSSEWFFWNESYCSIWRNSVCSFTIYCLSGWTIFKGCRCIIIHWHIWITFCEGWFSRLCLTLNICRCRIFRSWYNWSNLRCISCFNCSSICISCLNLNWNNITWIRFICWCESNYTCIFINCVSTNHITCWWFRIYWGCWLTRFIKESNWILVNWYYFITFCEGYGSSLNKTLRTSWFCRSCSWGNWSHRWCVSCRSFGSVLIFTNNRHCWSSSSKWFFWDKGYGSVCCYCVCTNAIDRLGSWTIIEGCWNNIVHWHAAVAFSKYGLTSLCSTLDICCFHWCCSRSYWSYGWCVGCWSLSPVLIFANNRHCRSSSSKWFLRNKGYSSVWCYCVSTNAINCLRS